MSKFYLILTIALLGSGLIANQIPASCHQLITRCFANSSESSPLRQTIDVYKQVWKELGTQLTVADLNRIAKGDPFSPTQSDGISPTLLDTLSQIKKMGLESNLTELELNEFATKALVELAEVKAQSQEKARKAESTSAGPLLIAIKNHGHEINWSPDGKYLMSLKFNTKTTSSGHVPRDLMVVVDRFGHEIIHAFGLGPIASALSLNDGVVLFQTSSGIYRVKVIDENEKILSQPKPKRIVSMKKLFKGKDEGAANITLLQDGRTVRVDLENDVTLMDLNGGNRIFLENFSQNYPYQYPIVIDPSKNRMIAAAIQENSPNSFRVRQVAPKTTEDEKVYTVSGLPQLSESDRILHFLTFSDTAGKLIGVYTDNRTRPSQRPLLIEFDLNTGKAKLIKISGPLSVTEKKETKYGDEIGYPVPLKDRKRFLFRRKSTYYILNAETGVSEEFPLEKRIRQTDEGVAIFSLQQDGNPTVKIQPFQNWLSVILSAGGQLFTTRIDLNPLLPPIP